MEWSITWTSSLLSSAIYDKHPSADSPALPANMGQNHMFYLPINIIYYDADHLH